LPADIVADSVSDFSGVQGANNWYYGFYDGDGPTPFQMGDFEELPTFGGGLLGFDYWHHTEGAGGYWTLVGDTRQHPNGTNGNLGRLPVEHWAVRRWVSPIAATVHIAGSYDAFDGSDDGVVGSIVVDDALMWSANVFTGEPGMFDFLADVQIGSHVDFVLAPRENDTNDSTNVVALISEVPEPSSLTLMVLAALGLSLIHRRTAIGRSRRA
jgi:hypothetical protein